MTLLTASTFSSTAAGMRPPSAASPGPAGGEAADAPTFGAWLLQASRPPEPPAAPPARPSGPEAPWHADERRAHAAGRSTQGPTAPAPAPAPSRATAANPPGLPSRRLPAQGDSAPHAPTPATATGTGKPASEPARAKDKPGAEPDETVTATAPALADALHPGPHAPRGGIVAADGQAAVGLKAGSVLGSAAGEGGRPGASEASRGRTREGLAKAGSASAASAASAREAGIAEGASAAQGQPGAPGSTGTGTATGSNTLGTATSANGSPPTSAAPGAGTQTGSAQAAPSAAFPLGAHGLVAASPQAGATSTAAAAPPLFALSPALDSPTFAPALGLQLSVLARDGIEQARIQLNPEALGPVAVQLSMAGQQIELEFVAAHARTREALEQALPQLASALGDAGFTMTGGGVFQQPRNGRDPRSPEPELPGTNRSSSGPAEHGASGEPAVSGLRPAAAPRGLVDLYA